MRGNIKNLIAGREGNYSRRKLSNWLDCPICGTSFYRRGNRKIKSKFGSTCSKDCKNKLHSKNKELLRPRKRSGLIGKCATCGNGTYSYPSRSIKFCSRKCWKENPSQWDRVRGKNNWNWNGGITDENKKLRNSIAGRNWRWSVFCRDHFKCIICGRGNIGLAADHIKPWALYPALRFDISNGQTLCRICHSVKTVADNKIIKQERRKSANQRSV